MKVKLLKSYILNTGKKLPVGQIVPRRRIEAEQMIKEGIAVAVDGPFPHKMRQKMKSELFKPKN